MSRKPCIHIGLGRTGTKTLQKHLFGRHPEINYLGKAPYRSEAVQDLVVSIKSLDEIEFDYEKYRRINSDYIEPELSGDKTLIISDEGLTSHAKADRGIVAHRLRYIFGDCKILITLREQKDMLVSLYLYFAGKGTFHYRNINKWMDWAHKKHGNSINSPFIRLKYFELIDYYARIFNEENVGIFLFEDMISDPVTFQEDICTFVGVTPSAAGDLLTGQHENPSPTGLAVAVRGMQSRVFRGFPVGLYLPEALRAAINKGLSAGRKADVRLSEKWSDFVDDYCREGNRKLVEQYGLPLEELGYPT